GRLRDGLLRAARLRARVRRPRARAAPVDVDRERRRGEDGGADRLVGRRMAAARRRPAGVLRGDPLSGPERRAPALAVPQLRRGARGRDLAARLGRVRLLREQIRVLQQGVGDALGGRRDADVAVAERRRAAARGRGERQSGAESRAAAGSARRGRAAGPREGLAAMDGDPRARFRALHARERLFVMPNPWDIGSARLLASCGFEALATTSAGFAWSIGKVDQTVTRDELVAHVAALAAATSLPLNVDSERCFPDDPGGVAETVTQLADAGAAGFSIEDYDPATDCIDDVDVAAERVSTAAEAGAGMVVTGRAENHLHGVDDLDDTIARLIAYRDAGA